MSLPLTIDEFMVFILGSSVDEVEGWKTSGSQGSRNALLTDERVITRVLNDINSTLPTVSDTVDAFDSRFSTIIGRELSDDQEDFEEIGSNLIIAVNTLKKQVAALQSGGASYTPTEEEQEVLDSGLTATILQQILIDLDNVFDPTEAQLDAMNSGITEIKLTGIESDIADLQTNKLDKSDFEAITEEDLDDVFEEVFGSGETPEP